MDWIKLHRKFKDWEWYNDSEMVHLFIHLLLSANHKEGNWKGVKVKRGQLVTGRKALSKSTGISQQTIRTCVDRLKSTNELTIKSTNKYSLVTLVNYDVYQNKRKESTNKTPADQPTTNQQLTTNKKVKNKEEYKIYISYLNKRTKRNYRGGENIKAKFEARIEEKFTLQDFQTAIENAIKDPFHKENSFKYLTPEFFTRPDKLDKFINTVSEINPLTDKQIKKFQDGLA